MKTLLLAMLILAVPTLLPAQNDLPRTEDVVTLDGIIAAYYDVVSHAAGDAYSTRPDGAPQGRGINSIQLYNDGERWWITDWIFDGEREDNEIPAEYQ